MGTSCTKDARAAGRRSNGSRNRRRGSDGFDTAIPDAPPGDRFDTVPALPPQHDVVEAKRAKRNKVSQRQDKQRDKENDEKAIRRLKELGAHSEPRDESSDDVGVVGAGMPGPTTLVTCRSVEVQPSLLSNPSSSSVLSTPTDLITMNGTGSFPAPAPPTTGTGMEETKKKEADGEPATTTTTAAAALPARKKKKNNIFFMDNQT